MGRQVSHTHGPLVLDTYDKKILHFLSQNIRYPQNKLAQELKISRQKLAYRIKRLKESIISPTISLNYPLLGLKSYILFIKAPFSSVSEIVGLPESYLIVELVGRYHYFVLVITEDILDFCQKYLAHVDLDIHKVHELIPDNHNPFDVQFPRKEKKTRKGFILDKYDYKILYYLAQDPEISNLALALKAGVDRKTVSLRVKKLEETVIQNFRYSIDIFGYGFLLYFLRIKCQPGSVQKVLAHIKNDKYSGFAYRSYSTVIAQYVPKNHKELSAFVHTLYGVDSTIQIEVMQNNGEYVVEPIPKIVLDYFKSKS